MKTFLFPITTSNVGIQITGLNTIFNSAVFFGYKSFTNGIPTNNTSGIYLGVNTGQMFLQVTSGAAVSWSLDGRREDDLTNWFVNGQSGDAVFIASYE